MSMARQELTRLTNAITTGFETKSNETMKASHHGRLRAFLPAEEAISQLRYATSSQTSLSTPDSRRSSNPWNRRRSRLSVSDPSLLNNAEIYYYNANHDSAQWQRVRPYVGTPDSQRSSTSTVKAGSPLQSELPTPPPTPPPQADSDGVPHGPMNKLRHLLKPKPILVFDHPPQELHEGDFRAALAFMGAIAGSPAGGSAMSRCLVEVTPEKGLPDSWMHIAPQDALCCH